MHIPQRELEYRTIQERECNYKELEETFEPLCQAEAFYELVTRPKLELQKHVFEILDDRLIKKFNQTIEEFVQTWVENQNRNNGQDFKVRQFLWTVSMTTDRINLSIQKYPEILNDLESRKANLQLYRSTSQKFEVIT